MINKLNDSFIETVKNRLLNKFKFKTRNLIIKKIKSLLLTVAITVMIGVLSYLFVKTIGSKEGNNIYFMLSFMLMMGSIAGAIVATIGSFLYLLGYRDTVKLKSYQDKYYNELWDLLENNEEFKAMNAEDPFNQLTKEEGEFLFNTSLNEEQITYVNNLMGEDKALTYEDLIVITELSIEKKKENIQSFTTRYNIKNKDIIKNIDSKYEMETYSVKELL